MRIQSIAVLVLSACVAFGRPATTQQANDNQRLDSLWHLRLSPRLSEPGWRDDFAYEAGLVLMVPVHAAFELKRPIWQQEFAEYFAGAPAGLSPLPTPETELNRLQYLYLASRFAVLATRAHRRDLIPHGLVKMIYRDINYMWSAMPAWMWDRPPFKGGVRDRLEWKLSSKPGRRSYYTAVTDAEQGLFAVAADLRQLENLGATGDDSISAAERAPIAEVLEAAARVYRTRITRVSTGWLFQVGYWRDHPEYAYAGRTTKRDGIGPAPIADIAEDASHAHRTALWLTSLADAQPSGSVERAFYLDLRRGLSTQFFKKVLVRPTPHFRDYRTTNFMDGRNGLYRWQYANRGTTWGYGPYELSGTLPFGWWAFLRDAKSRALFGDMAARFPIGPQIATLYLAPDGITQPLDRNWLLNGLAELLARLAARVDISGS